MRMKIYFVGRTDKIDYDEYDSFIVRAENKKDALQLLTNKEGFKEATTEIKEINIEGKSDIILGSFNAG